MHHYKYIKMLPLAELRERWAEAWHMKPHNRIGRKMLERSLIFKLRTKEQSSLTPEHMKRLNKFISAYKRNPNVFDQGHMTLKLGMKFIRNWQGVAHTVTVTRGGFEYKGQTYASLSKIANEITGSNWNGWLFFGLKKKKEAA